MVSCEVTVREWGNSLGVTFPINVVKEVKLKKGEKVDIIISKPARLPEAFFGMAKKRPKKSTQAILREMDEELYDD